MRRSGQQRIVGRAIGTGRSSPLGRPRATSTGTVGFFSGSFTQAVAQAVESGQRLVRQIETLLGSAEQEKAQERLVPIFLGSRFAGLQLQIAGLKELVETDKR